MGRRYLNRAFVLSEEQLNYRGNSWRCGSQRYLGCSHGTAPGRLSAVTSTLCCLPAPLKQPSAHLLPDSLLSILRTTPSSAQYPPHLYQFSGSVVFTACPQSFASKKSHHVSTTPSETYTPSQTYTACTCTNIRPRHNQIHHEHRKHH